jgi:hypothetical protein
MTTKHIATTAKWQIRQTWGLALLVLGMAGYSTPAISSPEKLSQGVGAATTFRCVQQGGGWVTIAKRGNVVSQSPIISWKTEEFGSQWTPKRRCETVSAKLTEAVANNGGRLGNLYLNAGKVENGKIVVCLLANKQQTSCTLDNMLFTLSQKNANNPREVIATIKRFTRGKASDSTVYENDDLPQLIPLEDLVNSSLVNSSEPPSSQDTQW